MPATAVPLSDSGQPAAQAARAEPAGQAGQMPGDGLRRGRQRRLPGGCAPSGKGLPVGGIGAAGMRRLRAPGGGVMGGGDGVRSPAPGPATAGGGAQPAMPGSTGAIRLMPV